MKRGDIFWAQLDPPAGRRPVVIVTRTSAIDALSRITVAPVTTHDRGLRSELPLGKLEGLQKRCVASCENLVTISKPLFDPEPIGKIALGRWPELDSALRFALGIRH